MHLITYRMSLEWSRIEPVEGEFNQETIEHYHKVLSALKEGRYSGCINTTS